MIVTTQRTAKRYKVLQAIGFVLYCFGLAVGLSRSLLWGLAMIAVGLCFSGLGKLLAWWNHG